MRGARQLEERRDVLALCLGLADGLGVDVTFVAQLVRFHLPLLAGFLEAGQPLDVELETATSEIGGHRGRIGAQNLGIEHGTTQWD